MQAYYEEHNTHIFNRKRGKKKGKILFKESEESYQKRMNQNKLVGYVFIMISIIASFLMILIPILLDFGGEGWFIMIMLLLFPVVCVFVGVLLIVFGKGYGPMVFFTTGIKTNGRKDGSPFRKYHDFVALTQARNKDGWTIVRFHSRDQNWVDIKLPANNPGLRENLDHIKMMIYGQHGGEHGTH